MFERMALLDQSAAASAMYANMSQYHNLVSHSRLMSPEHHANSGHNQAINNYHSSPPAHAQSAQAAAAAMAAFSSRFSIDDISVGGGVRSSPGQSGSANSSGADLSVPGSSPPSSGSVAAQKRRSSSESVNGGVLTMSLKVEPQPSQTAFTANHFGHGHMASSGRNQPPSHNHQQHQAPDSSTVEQPNSRHFQKVEAKSF